jgi:CheY-like chemotaxis protein
MKKKILLVDDDLAVLQSLARVLISEDYLPVLAKNGNEALDLAATKPVDLVMLDLTMPVKTGWQTFEGLTRDYPLLPIIIITARPNQLFPALAAGVGALMEKPLDFPKLLQTIRDLLAEPSETRLARTAGKLASFRYFPSAPAA